MTRTGCVLRVPIPVNGTEYKPETGEFQALATALDEDLQRFGSTGQRPGMQPSQSGWVLFSLSERADTSDAALLWPGGRWQPNKQVRERLAPIPQVSVEWNSPETVTAGTKPSIDISVTNDGPRPVQFVAGLNHYGGSRSYIGVDTLSRLIPANETVSWTSTTSHTTGAPPNEAGTTDDGEIHHEYELLW